MKLVAGEGRVCRSASGSRDGARMNLLWSGGLPALDGREGIPSHARVKSPTRPSASDDAPAGASSRRGRAGWRTARNGGGSEDARGIEILLSRPRCAASDASREDSVRRPMTGSRRSRVSESSRRETGRFRAARRILPDPASPRRRSRTPDAPAAGEADGASDGCGGMIPGVSRLLMTWSRDSRLTVNRPTPPWRRARRRRWGRRPAATAPCGRRGGWSFPCAPARGARRR
jgi:hypothetical protein